LEEAGLIHRARQGDDSAWFPLVREHQEVIFRLAYLILGDPDEAEDVAQETFIRAFRSLHRFDMHRPLRPWLLQIAANLARNRRRSWGRYWVALTRFGQSELGMQHARAEDPIDPMESGMLWEAVKQLSRTDQEVIYLRYFLDLSVDETAETLKVAPGTVKSRAHRGLGRLKEIILRDYPGLKEELVL
jgi:RNA polymerase sigma-70 factor, ECF subfamily